MKTYLNLLFSKNIGPFKPNRLVFKEAPNRHDYKKINTYTNKDQEVHTENLSVEMREYKREVGGISYNIYKALEDDEKFSKETSKSYTYEMLHAMDESLVASGAESPGRTGKLGIDALESYLVQQKVAQFAIMNGLIYFYNDEDVEIMSLPIISSRQAALRDSFYEQRQGVLEEDAQQRQDLRAELNDDGEPPIDMERDQIEYTSPDDSLAVQIDLPRVARPQFSMPDNFWIQQGVAPEKLASKFKRSAQCSGYVKLRLADEIGQQGLEYYNLDDSTEAWAWKGILNAQPEKFEQVVNLSHYMAMDQDTIYPIDTDTSQYVSDLNSIWDGMDEADAAGGQTVMTVFWKGSGYKGQVAEYNSQLTPEERSLNTHIVYLEGRDYRPITAAPLWREELTSYLVRNLEITSGQKGLLANTEVRVEDRDCVFEGGYFVDAETKEPVYLKHGQKVKFKDFWFSHHFHGAGLISLTELAGQDQFVPVEAYRLIPEELEEPRFAAPAAPELQPISHFYLESGGNVRDSFISYMKTQKQVEVTDTMWENYRWYLTLVGFNPSSVEAEVDAVPIPDFNQLAIYITEQDGWSGLRYKEVQAQCSEYNATHPTEHLVFIPKGEGNTYIGPWQLAASLFEELDPQPNRREKAYILGEIDRLNSTLDLRVNPNNQAHYRWESGSYFWLNDDAIEAIIHNVRRERVLTQIYVPPTLVVGQMEGGTKLVEITPHERQVIESATNDPTIRTLLILILLNEQKGGGNRKALAEAADKVPFISERSVGLFQIEPTRIDRERLEKEGTNFETVEDLRVALITDDDLNAKIAVWRLRDAQNSYQALLDENNETDYSIIDKNFITGVLTYYNRSPLNMYAGMFGVMGNRVAEHFGLELRCSDYEKKPDKRYHPMVNMVADKGLDLVNEGYEFLYEKGINARKGRWDWQLVPAEQVLGWDREGISEFWKSLARNLVAQGKIDLSEEEISRDVKLIDGHPYNFLNSPLYTAVKGTYETDAGEALSLLIRDEEYPTTAVQNYGYRVTRYEQIDNIDEYSFYIAEEDALAQDLQDPIDLKKINSIRSRAGIGTMLIEIDDEMVEMQSFFKEGEPFRVELTEQEKESLPEVNENGLISILLTGARATGSGVGLTDTNKQILINPRTWDVVVVDLPRDLKVRYTNKQNAPQTSRLNSVRNNGGQEALMDVVAEITGQEVVHTFDVSFEDTIEIMDELLPLIGGLEINDPQGNSYVGRYVSEHKGNQYFPAHTVINSGQEALAYTRFRKGWVVNDSYDPSIIDENGDPVNPRSIEGTPLDGSNTHRTERQNLLLTAFYRQAANRENLPKLIPKMIEIWTRVDTNAGVMEQAQYISVAEAMASQVRSGAALREKIAAVGSTGKIEPIEVPGIGYRGETLVHDSVYINGINAAFEEGLIDALTSNDQPGTEDSGDPLITTDEL
ncbi:LCP family protein [Candidatus Peregrinibacteria bacterium]|jgi:LCP family protein required for cell wall assembly|nr:LCP family protein [Candidatus Peregrinibacteria bacterium]MBT7703499.1 LCP family protein [Candidatus Peregrinibacteria bacterium]